MGGFWLGRGRGRGATPGFCYSLAAVPWWSPTCIGALEPFADPGPEGTEGPAGNPLASFPDAGVSAAAEGVLAGAWRRVEAAYIAGECELSVEGIGRFRIGPAGIAVNAEGPEGEPCPVLEALLGPALLLSLAASRRFALHASAALTGQRELLLFVGESGAGKSTLARFLGSRPRWQPVADDVLPVRWHSGALEALPWFPQLKLGRLGQYAGGGMPQALRVSRVFVVEMGSETSDVSVEPVGHFDALTALVRQTVSSRLFSPSMLGMHLEDFGHVAMSVPIYRLRVPRALERLGEVEEVLSRFSEANGGATGSR